MRIEEVDKLTGGEVQVEHGGELPERTRAGRKRRAMLAAMPIEKRAKIERADAERMLKMVDDEVERLKKSREWGKMVMYYQYAELEGKILSSDYINTPGHVCSRETCSLDLYEAYVYRIIIGTCYDAAIDKLLGGEPTLTTGMHICVPEKCEHIRAHRCEHPEACPHRFPHRPEDRKALKNFWVCSGTGTVHVCGDECSQTPIVTDKEGEYICPLTGVPRGLALGDNHRSNQWLTCHTAPLTLTNADNIEEEVKHHISLAMPSVRPPWEIEEDIFQYRVLVGIICDELMFSARRQANEIAAIRAAWIKMTNNASKLLRTPVTVFVSGGEPETDDEEEPPPPGPFSSVALPVNLQHVYAAVAAQVPRSALFRLVPPHPDVKKDIAALYADTPHMLRQQPLVHTHLHARGECAQCTVDAATAVRTRLLARLGSATTASDETTWESPRWKKFIETSKEIIATTAVAAWANLVKYTYNGNPRDVIPFKNIVVALIYMMQTEHTVPVKAAVPPGTDPINMPRVTVLPKIPITAILPPDTTMLDYNIPHYCVNHVKTMGSTQINIKSLFAKLVNSGRGYDIQLRL